MPQVRARIASSWRPLESLYAFHLGGWRRLRTLKVWDGASWKVIANFAPPLSVSISPSTAYGFANPLKPVVQIVTTSPLTATPSGGVAPFIYSWSVTSHTGTSPILSSPQSASTTASAAVAANTEQVATVHVTVTDALGTTAGTGGNLVFSNQSQIG